MLLDTATELVLELVERGLETKGTEGNARQVFFAKRLRELLAVDPRSSHDLERLRRPAPFGKVRSFDETAARIDVGFQNGNVQARTGLRVGKRTP